jgi:hypothetical protein
VLPLLLLAVVPAVPTWVAGLLLAGGEILDRIEFYHELRVPTPAGQIAADLLSATQMRSAA